MKKLLMIITLFVSSFFLFCNKEVKADSLTINFEDYSYVSSDLFDKIKNIAEETLSTLNLNGYAIFRFVSSSDSSINGYFIYYFSHDNLIVTHSRMTTSTGTNQYPDYQIGSTLAKYSYHKYVESTDTLNDVSSSSSKMGVYITNYMGNKPFYYLLYSTVPVIFTHYASRDLVVNYPDITYTFNSSNIGEVFPTLYDVYQQYGSVPEENPHQEEIDKVTNFYTMVIEKIEYLANEISNNYILLFVIGIFIVTFIFLLIFRRFL